MSILAIVQFSGNAEVFRKSLVDREAEYRQWHDKAVAAGALHHQFGIAGDSVVVIDEWLGQESFNAFFAQPDLQKFITEVGADSTPPAIIFAEAVDSPDKF
jgi:hypothetical protein